MAIVFAWTVSADLTCCQTLCTRLPCRLVPFLLHAPEHPSGVPLGPGPPKEAPPPKKKERGPPKEVQKKNKTIPPLLLP